MKNTPKTMDGNTIAVSKVFVFQSVPRNILYVREPKYPAKMPMKTKSRSIAVSNPPLLAGERKPKHAQMSTMKVQAISWAPVPIAMDKRLKYGGARKTSP